MVKQVMEANGYEWSGSVECDSPLFGSAARYTRDEPRDSGLEHIS